MLGRLLRGVLAGVVVGVVLLPAYAALGQSPAVVVLADF